MNLCVLSVPHTGSHFALELLKLLLRRNNAFIHLGREESGSFHVIYRDRELDRRKYIISNTLQEALKEIQIATMDGSIDSAILTHIGQPSYTSLLDRQARELLNVIPCISSIRDPLLSIVSCHIRNPALDSVYDFIVNGSLFLAKLYLSGSRIFILPVDLKRTNEEKIIVLGNIVDYLKRISSWKLHEEIELVSLYQFVSRWGKVGEWEREKVENTNITWSGYGDRIKKYYEEGDIERLLKIENIRWEYDRLRENKEVLKPFYEALGYSNLLWWE